MNNDCILYKGQVVVSFPGKPPVRRNNNGTTALFKLICNLLCSTVIKDSDKSMVKYFDILQVTDVSSCIQNILGSHGSYENFKNDSILHNKLPVTSRDVKVNNDDKTSSVNFSTVLHHNYTKSITSYDHNKTIILLLNGDLSVLAVAKFDFDISNVIGEEYTQCDISWSLSFSNKTEE